MPILFKKHINKFLPLSSLKSFISEKAMKSSLFNLSDYPIPS